MKIRNVQCSNQEKSSTVEGSLDNKQEDIKWKLLLCFYYYFFNSSILSKLSDCDQSLTAKAQNLCWQKVGLLSAVSSQSSFSQEEVRIC